MTKTEQAVVLNDKDIEGLVYYFSFWWAVLVLAPRNNQGIRSIFVRLGFVRARGSLSLTKSGERLIRFAKQTDRPRYKFRACAAHAKAKKGKR